MKRSYIIPHYVTVPPPAVPTGLTATAVSSSQINLSWNASAGPNLKDYGVYRVGAGLLGYTVSLTFSDTGLSASTAYTYYVTARDTGLVESSASGFASATTLTVGGALTHGQLFTLIGSNFGTKSRGLTPVAVDQSTAPTGTLDVTWTAGGVPNTSTNANFNLQNRTVPFNPSGATIGAPHSHILRIIAGCSGGSNPDAYGGSNTGMGVNFTRPTGDYVIWASMYYRADPNWVMGLTGTKDDNFKTYSLQSAGMPYPGNNQYAYLGFDPSGNGWGNPSLISRALSGTDGPHDTTAGFANPDASGNHSPYGRCLFPFNAANGWIKQEIEIYCTSSTTLAGGGRIDVFEYANPFFNVFSEVRGTSYRGFTDQFPGTARTFLFGGFQRDCGVLAVNNWRYFADVRFDMTAGGMSPGAHVARVYVGNNPVYGTQGMICEPQIPTAWADGSITFNFWKGALPGGTTGYIFVQPEIGPVIPAGSATIAVSP